MSADTQPTSPQGSPASPQVSHAPESIRDVPYQNAAPDRPSYLPPGINSGEDLAARYAELSRQADIDAGKGEVIDHRDGGLTGQNVAVPANTADAETLVASAGLDFSAFAQEYSEYGNLSSDSYEDLARAGISRAVVDQYIAGQHAQANGIKTQVFDAAGGEKSFQDMAHWASTSFNQNEIAAFNAVMNSGEIGSMRFAVEGLRARFEADVGVSPSLLGGYSGLSSGSSDVFASTAEMTAAMSDPRYAKDAAYRGAVIAKLGRSNIL